MIKKIKEYFELQSLYRKSKKVLIINAASTVTSLKNIVEKVETFIDSQENVVSLSKEDLNTMTKFMSAMMDNKDMQEMRDYYKDKPCYNCGADVIGFTPRTLKELEKIKEEQK